MALSLFCNLIEFIPFGLFQRKGKIEIFVNGVLIFGNRDAGDSIEGVNKKTIPLDNIEMKRGSRGKVEFFVWNGTDSESIRVQVAVKFSDNPISDEIGILPTLATQGNLFLIATRWDEIDNNDGGTPQKTFPTNPLGGIDDYTVPDNVVAKVFGTFNVEDLGGHTFIRFELRNDAFLFISILQTRAINLNEEFKLTMVAGDTFRVRGSTGSVADATATAIANIEEFQA